MEYRALGTTGLSVGIIGLGCAGFDGRSSAEIIGDMSYASSRGINLLDLFASDPNIRSGIGAALVGKRKSWIIQGHFGAAWVDGQYVRTRDMALVCSSFEDLLNRLQTDYLDIGMIHYVDSLSDWNNILSCGFMDYVIEQKRLGRVHHIGLSSHNPDVAIAAVETGLIEVLMFSINPCYDMQPADEDCEKLWSTDSYAHGLIGQNEARKRLYELCESRGVGIDVMKIFGGGDLLSEELSPFGRAFTPAQCIHYALTRPATASVICGCASITEQDSALEYLLAADSERDYSGVLAGLDRFSFAGHCLYCGHCAPCTMEIDIASVTKLLNLCAARGCVPETERDHYRLLAHHASDCIACRACEVRCPFGVDIITNMGRATATFGY